MRLSIWLVAPLPFIAVACSAWKHGAHPEKPPTTATNSQCFASKKECEQRRTAVVNTGTMPTAPLDDLRIPSTGPDGGGVMNEPEKFRWTTLNKQCEELVPSFPEESPAKGKGKKQAAANALFCFQAKGERKTSTAEK